MAVSVYTGTVSLTNNSPTITVSGFTLSPLSIFPGAQVSIDGEAYFLDAVVNTTTAALTRPYTGPTTSGLPLEINTISDEMTTIVSLNIRTADLIEDLLEFDPNGQVRTFGSLDGMGGNKGIVFGSTGQPETYPLSAFVRSISGSVDASALRGGLGIESTTIAISANTTLNASSRSKLYNVNASAGARTITLPAVSSAGDGFTVIIRASNATNFVTVTASGAELIDGLSSFKLTLTGHLAVFRCNGTSWNVVCQDGTLETGSNANGFYEKYSDGKLICFGQGPGTVATGAQGAMFQGDESITYPFPFNGSRVPIVTARVTSSNRLVNPRAASSVGTTIRHFSTVSDSTTVGAFYRVEGIWFAP